MNKAIEENHVGEMLSGFIDGELTQQERQRVQLHCDSCDTCRSELETLRAMRERMGKARLSSVGQDIWRETMDDTAVKATRGIGWLVLIGAALILGGAILIEFFTNEHNLSATEMLIFGGIYGGLFLLFISVLRQRLIERKTDKYKDVEI